MIRCDYVDVADGQIHYRTVAGTGTPVVFFHQTASSGQMFIEVMRRLDGIGPLYALDTPGFGGSFDTQGMPTMRRYGQWMLEAIDALGLERVHLVGHHTGACIAVEIADLAPQRVATLSLIGPVPLTAAERSEFRKHFSTPMSPTTDGSYLKQTWDYLASLGADSSLPLRHREIVDTLRAYYGRFQAYSAVWDQDFTSLFAAAQCPMLLMCAPGDVLIAYFERACAMKPAAAGALVGGTNFEPDQDPNGVAAAIRDFLTANPA